MLNQFGFLAALEVVEESGIYARMSEGTREALIILGAIFLIVLLVLVWAVALRKPRRRPRQRRQEAPASLVRYRHQREEDQGLFTLLQQRHRRRKHRFHHRNPTLAETGGLPPVRPDETASPAPPPAR